MSNDLDKIRLLRKLTSAGVLKCRKALSECSGDLNKALMCLRETRADTSFCCEGDLYLAYVRTRLGICLFRVYANDNIYNNRLAWCLKQILNQALSYVEPDSESVLSIRQVNGILVHSCVFLKLDGNACGVYFHGKVWDFVYKKGALLMLSALGCGHNHVSWLSAELAKQLLFGVVVNNVRTLNELLRCQYIYNNEYSTRQVIELFQLRFNCRVSLNLALTLC